MVLSIILAIVVWFGIGFLCTIWAKRLTKDVSGKEPIFTIETFACIAGPLLLIGILFFSIGQRSQAS